MEYNLKPCPFCGNKVKPFFLEVEEYRMRRKEQQKGFIAIQCPFCEVVVTHADNYYFGPRIEIPLEETVGFEEIEPLWDRRF